MTEMANTRSEAMKMFCPTKPSVAMSAQTTGPAADGSGTAMTDQHQHGAGSGIPDPFEI
ncbi:MAG: hypothetical protein WA021_05805 [Minisyncoccia bacterium]